GEFPGDGPGRARTAAFSGVLSVKARSSIQPADPALSLDGEDTAGAEARHQPRRPLPIPQQFQPRYLGFRALSFVDEHQQLSTPAGLPSHMLSANPVLLKVIL